MIEHVSISSAGPNGLTQIGMIQRVIELGILDINLVKSIHGTSAGSMIAVLLAMRIPIQEIMDYLVMRPWHKWAKLDLDQFMIKKGCVSDEYLRDIVAPFFHAYDFPETITMLELFDKTGIDVHIYTTAVTTMSMIDINHSTFPNVEVIKALCMSSSIPVLFTPVHYENEYYIDGGVLMRCPILPYPKEECIYFLIDYKPCVDLETSLGFIQHIMVELMNKVSMNTYPVGNVYTCDSPSCIDANSCLTFLMDETFRRKMVDLGIQLVNEKNIGV